MIPASLILYGIIFVLVSLMLTGWWLRGVGVVLIACGIGIASAPERDHDFSYWIKKWRR